MITADSTRCAFVKPEDAKQELERRIKASGTPIECLTPAQGIRLMLDFYRDIRADGCELDKDGDTLLFQWGTHELGEGHSFRFDITRQFNLVETEDEDAAMSQLSLTVHFAPSVELEAFQDGDRWCSTPDGLEDFEAFICSGETFRSVGYARGVKVTLDYSNI